MRILHVSPDLSPSLGGTTTCAVEMCKALTRAGAGITLISTNLDEVGKWRPAYRPKTLNVSTVSDDGLTIHYFPTSWPTRLGVSRALNEYLRAKVADYDLVHVHRLYRFSTVAAFRQAGRRGVPYVVSPHGVLLPYHRRRRRARKAAFDALIQNAGLRRAAAIHYATPYELALAPPLPALVPTLVIPIGVNAEDFAKLPTRGSFRRNHRELSDKKLIVSLGRLAPQKGLDLLIKAFAGVAKTLEDAHLVIAGPDELGHRRTVERWLKTAGVESRTTLTGPLYGEEKLRLLADTDLWVLPSYAENFGIAVVEALACGLPVIISDRVGIADEVAKAGAGVVVPCDADALESAMLAVLANASLRRTLCRNGPSLVRSRYTWDYGARQMIGSYEEILSARGAGRTVTA